MTQYLSKYRVESNRLKGFDYGSNGNYFVTICTFKKINYFGHFNSTPGGVETDYNPSLQLFEMGFKAKEYWEEIPSHFPFVKLGKFVVMPDHVHGTINIENSYKKEFVSNSFSSPNQNLGSIVRSYKGAVKRYATRNNIEFKWQRGYHDRIVRSVNALSTIENYIKNNPIR